MAIGKKYCTGLRRCNFNTKCPVSVKILCLLVYVGKSTESDIELYYSIILDLI